MIDTTSYRSPNHSPRPDDIQPVAIVLHSGEGRKNSDLNWLCSPKSKVSTHYYIDRGGLAYELVSPDRQAWHAGKSAYAGLSDWNQFSLGVELEHIAGQDWQPGQIVALRSLCKQLINMYDIPQRLVVAHRWIAIPADRKKDPSDWTNDNLHGFIAELYAPSSSYPCGATYRVLSDGSRVRRLPTTNSSVVDTLPAGREIVGVEVLGTAHAADRRWIYYPLIGYVHMSLLELEL